MPRMPLCGGLRIGVDSSEPKTPPLVIVNVPPWISSIGVFSFAGALAELADRLLDAGEARAGRRRGPPGPPGPSRCRPRRRCRNSCCRRCRAVDLGVDRGERLQASTPALTKKDMKPRLRRRASSGMTPCTLARAPSPRHVDLVEGREDGGGVLGLDQALGDLLARLGYPLALFARRVVRRGGRARLGRR